MMTCGKMDGLRTEGEMWTQLSSLAAKTQFGSPVRTFGEEASLKEAKVEMFLWVEGSLKVPSDLFVISEGVSPSD